MKSINSISSQKSKSNLLLSTILEPNCLSNTRISKQSNPNQLPKSIYITIQDSICQSALPIINQIIQSFTLQSSETTKLSNQKLLVIGLNYHPSIFKNHLNEHQFNRINLSSNDSKEINVNGLLELVEIELNPIQPESSITIIIDSLGECIRRWSIKDTLRLFTQLLKKYQSKLIVIDSPHLYTQEIKHSQTINSSISFTSSSFVTQSSIHLKLYPTSLYHHLIHQFQIPVPIPIRQSSSTNVKQNGTSYDPRFFSLLEELNQTMNPFSSDSIITPQALLIPQSSSSFETGSCLIRWISKNLTTSTSFDSTSLNLNLPNLKKPSSVLHGLEALKLDENQFNSQSLGLVPVSIEEIEIKPIRSILNKSSYQQKDSMNDLQEKVTFNLSLTEQQRIDREQVQLPFLPKRDQDGLVIEAPGEIYDGSFQSQSKGNSSNGLIVYEPDSADDMDDEEPDDEL